MYSTELRASTWRSIPWGVRIVIGIGFVAGFVALWGAWVAASSAHSASADAEAAIAQVRQEGLERDFELCTASNSARAGIITFIDGIVRQDGDVSPGEQAALDLAADTFAPLKCPPDPSP